MKQVIQSLKSGVVDVVDVPLPIASPNMLRVRSSVSLISAGTERMMIDFGRGNWLQKARQQPDKVRMVLEKARTDGPLATLQSVRNKLDQPLAPGYCNVGVIDAVGRGASGFAVGDRVASNGKHAEYVVVPVNLCARIPDNVSDEDAVFTVVGAIALQGIRLADVQLGSAVAVMGLGLIGLLTVQLLQAQGCRVIGFDFDPTKIALAERFGAQGVQLGEGVDPVAAAMAFSRDRGIDAVLITAATDSNDPIHHAAQMSRKRGRVILVGVAGLELSRADFFEKELTFQVSCSYGPGRYDPRYEEAGIDYPVGFVRWTEQRNFEAVLDMMAAGKLDLAALRSHRFAIGDASAAYDVIGGSEPSLGVLLAYPVAKTSYTDAVVLPDRRIVLDHRPARDGVMINMVGAGNYAAAVLLPAFAKAGAGLGVIASNGGLTAATQARKFGFSAVSTDIPDVVADPAATAIVIATRHDSHAALTVDALAQGKHVFVEKPLGLTGEEIDQVQAAYEASPKAMLMVGFNRRFAPSVVSAKRLLERNASPSSFIYTVNAGAIPAEHWTQDRDIGGGRIIGEVCHFVDLLRFLAGAAIVRHEIVRMEATTADTIAITLAFANGSLGTIQYLANGHRGFPKERIEIFTAGKVLQIDNFRRINGFGVAGSGKLPALRQDKGQAACAQAFVNAIRTGGQSPIPAEELFEVARVCVALAQAV